MTRVALWCRVSQGEEQTTENQLQALRALAAHREYEIVREYSVEASAYTGSHQPELRAALEDARRGEYKVLIVWSIDRLSREGILATLSLLNRFLQYGVEVVSHQEPWTETTGGDVRELLLAVTAWVAQQESERRSQRVKAGMDRRRAQGLPVGRPPGAKDAKPRKRSGYVRRYEDRRGGT